MSRVLILKSFHGIYLATSTDNMVYIYIYIYIYHVIQYIYIYIYIVYILNVCTF